MSGLSDDIVSTFRRNGRFERILPFLESVGGILLLTIFFLTFYGSSSLLYPRFHPFLVVVLLVAGRYGFVAGVFAALFGVSDFYLLHLRQNHWDSLMPGNFSFLWPSAFLFSGMILGEMRDSERRRYEALHGKFLKEQDAARTAELERDILLRAKKELERRIFLEPNVVNDLFDVFRSLEKDEIDNLSSSLLSLFSTFVGADSVALYRKERREFILEAEEGDLPLPQRVKLDYGPFLRAASTGEAVTLRTHGILPHIERQDGESLRPIALYPIRGRDEHVEKILVIWHAPFEKLTPEFFQMAGMIAERASARLTFLRSQKEAQDGIALDGKTGFLRPVFFARRAAEELGKALRYHAEISLLALHFSDSTGEEVDQHSAFMAMRDVARKLLREVDLIGLISDGGGIALCLPHTGETGAQVVEKKLLDLWSERVAGSPLLEGVHLACRRQSFLPTGDDSARIIEVEMMDFLDRMFSFDPSSRVFGEYGFALNVMKEQAEAEGTMGLLRLSFSVPSWDELLMIRKSLNQIKNHEGRLLFSYDSQVGLSLDGRTLWILDSDIPGEGLSVCQSALFDLWNKVDLPKLKKGTMKLEGEVMPPGIFKEGTLFFDLQRILRSEVPLWEEGEEFKGDESWDSERDRGVETGPDPCSKLSFFDRKEEFLKIEESEHIPPDLPEKVEALIRSQGVSGMTCRDLRKYSRGFARLSRPAQSLLLDLLVQKGRLFREETSGRGRPKVGYIHESFKESKNGG